MTSQNIPSDISELLTERELEVLERIVGTTCSTTPEIAAALKVSSRTIDCHRQNLMKKLAAKNVAHLARMVLCGG